MVEKPSASKSAAQKEDPDEVLYSKLERLRRRRDELRLEERAVVAELRKNPRKNSFTKIAGRYGISVGAAWSRWGQTENTTPESRRAQSAMAQKRVTPSNSPGVNITEAARQLETARDTIYAAIKRNPDADWFVTVELEGGKRKTATRIVNLEELQKAMLRQSRGTSKLGE